MTIPDLIAGVLAACAMIGAYVIEWRRGNNAERTTALEARVAALEALPRNDARIAAMEASMERLRRNL
jgi:hypothetical protein